MAKKVENKPTNTESPGEPLGYPSYPKSQDIYEAFKEEREIDPEDPSHKKESDPDPDNALQGDEPLDEIVDDTNMGDDLDVPGSELDDEQEELGNEDEENNYYSIGGDKELDEARDDV
jgi:hypothetical protein